jgi:uncharacterized protein YcbK (DUF882 family)
MSPRVIPDYPLMPNFTANEFVCKCGVCRGGMMTMRLLVSLDALRRRWGKPLTVTSGFRCPYQNRAVGGSRESQHLTGNAVDLAGEGVPSLEFVKAAIYAGFGGIGVGENFIHIDVRKIEARSAPVAWTYSGGKRHPGSVMVEVAWAQTVADADKP